MNDSISLRSFQIRENAEIARGLLEEAGIDALLTSDDAGGAFPSIFLSGQGFMLFVAPDDEERAREVLAVLDPENTR